MSSTARLRWRLRLMAKGFCCNGRVEGSTATPSFSSAHPAIGAIAIAARSAAGKPAFANGDAPMGGTSAARKAGRIIATGNGNIGFVSRPPWRP